MRTSKTNPDGTVVVSETMTCTGSAVSWPAIIAGAFIAAAMSLALLLLGSSFGLAMASPWANRGFSAAALTANAAIWLVVMQWASSALGGYLTGRLRTKWHSTHTDEVFFRDTAHGLVMWSVATVITAVFLAGAAASVVGGGAKLAAIDMSNGPEANRGNDYFIDGMLRSDKPAGDTREAHMEASRIFATDMAAGSFPQEDRDYLARVVAARSNLTMSEANARVDNAITKTKEAADKARKVAATTAIFTFISMLVGAFIACLAAAMGGRHRDTLYPVIF